MSVNLRIAPTWLTLDKQVLRFRCYFKEAVPDSAVERFRVRKCVLSYYLEDDSISIVEPRELNSGLMQGPIVSRCSTELRPSDLRQGAEILINAIRYRITEADEFTRSYYGTHSLSIGGAVETTPADDFSSSLLAKKVLEEMPLSAELIYAKEYNEVKAGGSRVDRQFKQYIENDRKVLNFDAYWDDPTRYGQRLFLEVNYFLADDSIEIIEPTQKNSGRWDFPVFFKRSKLVKNREIAAPGIRPFSEIIKFHDLKIGGILPVLGRNLTLFACDPFTRSFFQKIGSPQPPAMTIAESAVTLPTPPPPPYNGYGSEEDSLANCYSLLPKPQTADMNRALLFGGKVLRFEAEYLSRKFVISFYLEDGSIAVFEPKQPNSGFLGGRFAERSKRVNKNTGKYFDVADFKIGENIVVNGAEFKLLGSDEFSKKFLVH